MSHAHKQNLIIDDRPYSSSPLAEYKNEEGWRLITLCSGVE